MDLHKIHHPGNFEFLQELSGRGNQRAAESHIGKIELSVSPLGEDVFRIDLSNRRWPKRRCLYELNDQVFEGHGGWKLTIGRKGELLLHSKTEATVLHGASGATFGVCGDAWMLRLVPNSNDRFYGMGEKWGPLEKSGQKSQFWTTDVWADFTPAEIGEARIDAPYAAVPYLIVEREGVYFGILLDNPYRSFMATNPVLSLSGDDPFATASQEPAGSGSGGAGSFYVGSTNGQPIVYLLVGSTLRELTRKLQRLVGTTPRPPLWALGHQQSRWGYQDVEDLLSLDDLFVEHGIPNDGLWLDIDYMDGYRVFTTTKGAAPAEEPTASTLHKRRRKIVAILDPGVKVDPGFSVYREGVSGGHFCQSPSGDPYVGIVWPGATHFPDFSQKKTRAWWANHVACLAHRGFDGFWIDMNDPSTGPVENQSMRFQAGRLSHDAIHNQYALGMAQATQDGLEQALPAARPFVLSRSAFTTMARHAAVWTGDNVSSFQHLAASIPTSLNLALSGIPFNGPDVPGFGADATDDLAIRFYQATFLFPFLRNHSVRGCRRQEPWAFSRKTQGILRRYIRLRYRLLPYLYQLFIDQEAAGEPILAPPFIDRDSSKGWEKIEDEFLIGRLLQAPIVGDEKQRSIKLPEGWWYCLRTGSWVAGESECSVPVPLSETPLYVRSGTLLPIANAATVLAPDGGAPAPLKLLTNVDFHVFLRPGDEARLDYQYDDGASVDYEAGVCRHVSLEMTRRGKECELVLGASKDVELPPLHSRFVLHGGGSALRGPDGDIPLRVAKETLVGPPLAVQVSKRTNL